MAIHIAYIKLVPVDSVGNPINKNSATIGQVLGQMDTVPVVVPNSTYAPNASLQTIEEYLTEEDAAGFNLVHIDNTMIITQN